MVARKEAGNVSAKSLNIGRGAWKNTTWGDPGPHIPIDMSDLERGIHDAKNEVIREITALQFEIEQQR